MTESLTTTTQSLTATTHWPLLPRLIILEIIILKNVSVGYRRAFGAVNVWKVDKGLEKVVSSAHAFLTNAVAAWVEDGHKISQQTIRTTRLLTECISISLACRKYSSYNMGRGGGEDSV